jgi:hypothetical protein
MEEKLLAVVMPAVSGLVGDRVHWTISPQGTPTPRVVLHRIDGVRSYATSGAVDYVQSRVQVDCFGAAIRETKDLARAVISAVSGYSDQYFMGIFVDAERDMFETNSRQNAPDKIFRTTVDLIVHHKI